MYGAGDEYILRRPAAPLYRQWRRPLGRQPVLRLQAIVERSGTRLASISMNEESSLRGLEESLGGVYGGVLDIRYGTYVLLRDLAFKLCSRDAKGLSESSSSILGPY